MPGVTSSKQPPQDNFNPYAPPAVPRTVRRQDRPPVSRAIVAVYVLGVAEVLYYAAVAISGVAGMTPDGIKSLVAVGPVISLAFSLMGIVWLDGVLDRLPIPHRDDRFKSGVLLKFFIPVYNIYWMFEVTTGVCDILDGGLSRYRRGRSAPRTLATNTCGAHIAVSVITRVAKGTLLGFVGIVTPILWMVFMFRVEASLRELSDAVTADEA